MSWITSPNRVAQKVNHICFGLTMLVRLNVWEKQGFYWYFDIFMNTIMWTNWFYCYSIKYSMVHWHKPVRVIIVYYNV